MSDDAGCECGYYELDVEYDSAVYGVDVYGCECGDYGGCGAYCDEAYYVKDDV